MNRYVAVASSVFGFMVAATAWAGDVVKVSGHPDWAPYSWEADGKIVGVGADLAEVVFKDIGLGTSSLSVGNWKRVQASAQSGELDAIVGIYVNDERKAYLSYADPPYTYDQNVIWVPKGKGFPFQKWDDLIGKNGTATLGESYGADFDKFMEEKLSVERVAKPELNMTKLDAGRVEYYPFSQYGGQIQMKSLGMDGKFEMLATPISKEGVFLAVSKASPYATRIPQLNEAIKKRIADGTVDTLIRKNLDLAAKPKAP